MFEAPVITRRLVALGGATNTHWSPTRWTSAPTASGGTCEHTSHRSRDAVVSGRDLGPRVVTPRSWRTPHQLHRLRTVAPDIALLTETRLPVAAGVGRLAVRMARENPTWGYRRIHCDNEDVAFRGPV